MSTYNPKGFICATKLAVDSRKMVRKRRRDFKVVKG
jgi:hypothetical protein